MLHYNFTEQVWFSVATIVVVGRHLVRISVGIPAVVTVFVGFPQYLQANSSVVPA
jgi:hypothetical protein